MRCFALFTRALDRLLHLAVEATRRDERRGESRVPQQLLAGRPLGGCALHSATLRCAAPRCVA